MYTSQTTALQPTLSGAQITTAQRVELQAVLSAREPSRGLSLSELDVSFGSSTTHGKKDVCKHVREWYKTAKTFSLREFVHKISLLILGILVVYLLLYEKVNYQQTFSSHLSFIFFFLVLSHTGLSGCYFCLWILL